MAFEDANSILAGPRQAIAKFDKVGDSITGTLLDADVQPVTDPKGVVQTDKNGNVKKQIIYVLQTDERDPEIDDDDGQRRVFAKWAIQKAISEYLAENGLTKVGLQEGGTLTVTHTATKKSTTPGYSDTKLFEASYAPPPPRKLPTGTKDENPWVNGADGPEQVTAGSQPMQDLAWSIYNANPKTPRETIAAATGISVADLETMFDAI